MSALAAAGYLVGAYLIGSIPFAYLTARAFAGADLRKVGSGTVSGTGVGQTVGFWAMALSGILDILKAVAVVVFVMGPHPLLAACGAGAAAVGHNWSVFLKGAGGRALCIGLGVTAVMAWPGLLVLAFGMGVFRIFRQTGLGSALALVALPVVLPLTAGLPGTVESPTVGLALGLALILPMWVKRLVGNHPFEPARPAVYVSRLLFDNDTGWPVPRTAAD